jgi:hypothetical protein
MSHFDSIFQDLSEKFQSMEPLIDYLDRVAEACNSNDFTMSFANMHQQSVFYRGSFREMSVMEIKMDLCNNQSLALVDESFEFVDSDGLLKNDHRKFYAVSLKFLVNGKNVQYALTRIAREISHGKPYELSARDDKNPVIVDSVESLFTILGK